LRVLSKLKCFFRAFETELRKREPEGIVGLLEALARDVEILGKRLTHTGKLRTLAWEQKGCLQCANSTF